MTTTTRTPEEHDRHVRVAQHAFNRARAELAEAKAERREALLPRNPFKVGDLVHIYARSQDAVTVTKVNIASVVVQHAGVYSWRERVPLHRVRLAEKEVRA